MKKKLFWKKRKSVRKSQSCGKGHYDHLCLLFLVSSVTLVSNVNLMWKTCKTFSFSFPINLTVVGISFSHICVDVVVVVVSMMSLSSV